MSVTITINGVRASYCNLFQARPPFNNPNGDPKFSVTVLVPKSNLEAKAAIDQAIAQAIEQGVSSVWNGQRPPQPAICVHDGDGVRPSDGSAFGPECKGMWVFTASCKADRPPFVVDNEVHNIINPTACYSGMWGNISVSFFAYNAAGKKGIGCGLNGFQKVRDDEPLGSVITAKDAFKPVAASAAAPATPGYSVPGYTQPAAVPVAQPAAVPPQYAPAAPGYGIDPITGQPVAPQGYQPTGMPVAGI